jgi:hypothetical protein
VWFQARLRIALVSKTLCAFMRDRSKITTAPTCTIALSNATARNFSSLGHIWMSDMAIMLARPMVFHVRLNSHTRTAESEASITCRTPCEVPIYV